MRELISPTVPIVIDPGTYRWRVGFANLEKPKSSFITETLMLDGVSSWSANFIFSADLIS